MSEHIKLFLGVFVAVIAAVVTLKAAGVWC